MAYIFCLAVENGICLHLGMYCREYSATKYVSVLLISVGIALCTIMSATTNDDINKVDDVTEDDYVTKGDTFWLCIGIGLLTFGLLVSACMGIYQGGRFWQTRIKKLP